MALHPTTRILMALSLIIASSALTIYPLTAALLLLASTLWVLKDSVAWRWLRRARLLLFVPLLMSSYVTAGDGVFPALDAWTPTWQGLAHGTLQSLRLVVALLGLRLVMRSLSTEEMTAGLTTLLSPLAYIGADIALFARRLGLTLAYLEQLDGKKAGELLRGPMPSRLVPLHNNEPRSSAVFRFGFLDVLLLALTIAILYRLLA